MHTCVFIHTTYTLSLEDISTVKTHTLFFLSGNIVPNFIQSNSSSFNSSDSLTGSQAASLLPSNCPLILDDVLHLSWAEVWLPMLDPKRRGRPLDCLLPESAHPSRGHPDHPAERQAWQGTEASCQRPARSQGLPRLGRRSAGRSSVKLSGDCSPCGWLTFWETLAQDRPAELLPDPWPSETALENKC